ncbi:MAG: hypothetical protein Q3979_10050 [Actinomycetaceae bacterium]|nr:hypothetical protein [Actinomycetaceae bacterium]
MRARNHSRYNNEQAAHDSQATRDSTRPTPTRDGSAAQDSGHHEAAGSTAQGDDANATAEHHQEDPATRSSDHHEPTPDSHPASYYRKPGTLHNIAGALAACLLAISFTVSSQYASEPYIPFGTTTKGHLCDGFLSDDFLKDELDFTSSPNNYKYANYPPSSSSLYGSRSNHNGVMTCELHDDADGAYLIIEYSDSGEWVWLEEEADSNEDGDWTPLSIKGQEGKGWIYEGDDYIPKALWVFPDGSDLVVRSFRTTDADNVRTLMRAIVGTAAEHNKSSGKVSRKSFVPEDSGTTSQASTNGVSDEARLCGGILTDDFLKNELSFTSSSAAYRYSNQPGHDMGSTECTLYDNKLNQLYDERTSNKHLSIEYQTEVSSEAEITVSKAESNERRNWRPFTLDGREGKGWIQRDPVRMWEPMAVWINPDGSVVLVKLGEYDDDDSGWFNSEDEMNTGTEESVKALMHRVLDTAPEHNKTAGRVSERAGYGDR